MRFLFIIPVMVFTFGAVAQELKTETIVETKKSKGFLSNFSGSLSLTGNSDFKETNNSSKTYNSEISTLINYKLDKDDSLRFDISMSKDLENNYEETLGDGRISHTRSGVYSYKNYTLGIRTSLRIPLSESSIKKDRIKTALELNLLNSFNLDNYVTGLSFTYIPRYRRFFNEFKTDINGNNLVEQNLINILVLGWQTTEKVSLSSTVVYILSRGYNGADSPNSYSTAQDITYSFNSIASANIGIQTGGSIRSYERGTDTSIEFFDINKTSFYTGLNLAF